MTMRELGSLPLGTPLYAGAGGRQVGVTAKTRTGVYYVKHEAHEPAITTPCPCDICGLQAMVGPVDATGRPVPAWALGAFKVLSEDGRRVCVNNWPGDLPKQAPHRPTDVMLCGHVVTSRRLMSLGVAPGKVVKGDVLGAASAMLMAERQAFPEGALMGGQSRPGKNASQRELMEEQIAQRAAGIYRRHRVDELQAMGALPAPAPRHHNATCRVCSGPAYEGLLSVQCLSPKCEPPVWERGPEMVERRLDPQRHLQGEHVWFVGGHHFSAMHPIRETAVAMWREAVRKDAGK